MNVEQARKVAGEAIESLAAALERGESEQLKAYLATAGRFHRYSLSNQILIASQRENATRVAGFWTWKRLGRSVRKGERGIAILAPILRRRKKADADDARPRVEPEDQSATADDVVTYRIAHVFDVQQTQTYGQALLPEFARIGGEPRAYLQRLHALVHVRGIKVEYATALGGATGVSTGGTILLRDNLAPAEEFNVLSHELAHELLHRDRQPRSRTVEETEAEAVAYAVGCAVGLDQRTHSSDYLQLYQGDVKTLSASLRRIRDTAAEIINAIQGDVQRHTDLARAA